LHHELARIFRQTGIRLPQGTGTAQAQHQIQPSQLPLLRTKRFSQLAFDPVPVDCQALDFAGDDQPQAGMCSIIRFCKNLKEFAAHRTAKPDNRGEFFCMVKPVTFRKANNKIPIKLAMQSYCQTCPSLRTTSTDDERSASGFHPDSESVRPLPARHGRLISAFHRSSFSPEPAK
jgi:hypothetical protein